MNPIERIIGRNPGTKPMRRRVQNVDRHKGVIFWHYISKNHTADQVIALLKKRHDLVVSPKVLKTKLGRWGFGKNYKRSDVVRITQELERRELSNRRRVYFTLKERPVDYQQVERHRRRSRLMNNRSQAVISLELPEPLVLNPGHLRSSERFLFHLEYLIKGSFEKGTWQDVGHDSIIKSSETQVEEIKTLHDFLAYFSVRCLAIENGDEDRAEACWLGVMEKTKTLVQSSYHEVIPSLVQMVNDINRQSPKLGRVLKMHIVECSKNLSTNPNLQVLQELGDIEMMYMPDIEQRIFSQYLDLFDMYMDLDCYSIHVTMMDELRRKLLHDPSESFDCLPDLGSLDEDFGQIDRRSLDLIGLRVEVLSHRNLHEKAELEALQLVQRAEFIADDDWLRFYNLTRGWYFLGTAQYFLKKREAAIQSFSNALESDEELCEIDGFHIFNTENAIMEMYLQHLRSSKWSLESDLNPIGRLVFFRCCKQPMMPYESDTGSQEDAEDFKNAEDAKDIKRL